MDRIVRAETAAMQVTIASLIGEIIETRLRRGSRWRATRPVAEKIVSE
jgi:hypothetical protein